MSLMNLLQSEDPAIQNGLLNFGLSLLQSKGNFGNAVGQAGVAGQLGARDFRRQQALMSRASLGDQLMQSQIEEEKLKVKERDAAARRKLEVDQYLQSLQPVQGINANQATGIAGPTPQAASAIGQRPAIDPMQALRLLGPDGAKALFEAQNWGRPKVARTIESVDAQGNKVIKQLDDYGQEQGAGIPGYVPAQLINQGNKQTFAIPRAGASFDMGVAPADAQRIAQGWANVGISREGLGLQRERLAFDKTQPSKADKPSATQEKAELDKAKTGRQSEQMITAISDARKLLGNKTTASGVGAAVDWTGRQFGVTSETAQNAAKLETLAGWMVANVPRMEGPQSNYDVENYKTMAAKVGDRSTPVEERVAALDTLESLHRKYAEINGTPLPPAVPQGSWEESKESRYQAWKKAQK